MAPVELAETFYTNVKSDFQNSRPITIKSNVRSFSSISPIINAFNPNNSTIYAIYVPFSKAPTQGSNQHKIWQQLRLKILSICEPIFLLLNTINFRQLWHSPVLLDWFGSHSPTISQETDQKIHPTFSDPMNRHSNGSHLIHKFWFHLERK